MIDFELGGGMSAASAADTLGRIQNGHGNSIGHGNMRQLAKALRGGRNHGAVMKALAKSGSVGYPTQAQAATSGSGSELAPLVPQSINPTLVSDTLEQADVRFYGMVPKETVYGTIHEYVNVKQGGYNDDVHGFFAEGGAPAVSSTTYEKDINHLKFVGDKWQISDVARTVTGIGFGGMAPRSLLNTETESSVIRLSAKIERDLFWADQDLFGGSATGSLAWNGLYRQTVGDGIAAGSFYTAGLPYDKTNGNNYQDMRGVELDHSTLIDRAFKMSGSPTFAKPNVLMVGPATYGKFVQQALAFQRVDGAKPRDGFQFGPTGDLHFAGPRGPVRVMMLPLLPHNNVARATASSSDAPTIAAVTALGTSPAGSSASRWAAGDAGDYIYRIVPVGDKGAGALKDVAATGVVAGDAVNINIQDAGIQGSGAGNVRYYEVYRSEKDGAADTAQFLFRYPTNTSGTASGTLIVDENKHLPGTAPAYLMEFNKQTLYCPELLPMTRRPLPSTDTTANMLTMTFMSLLVRRANKIFVFDNCQEL